MQEPQISVVIPTFNRDYVIGNAIQSVLNQTFQNFELIVIDDASADQTEKVVRGFHDPRIRYYYLTRNVGAAKARNEGVKKAKGKFIAFQDSDDFWYPGKLESQMRFMNEHKDCDFTFCRMLLKGPQDIVFPQEECFDMHLCEFGFLDILLEYNRVGTPAILMKKSLFEEIGGFNEAFKTLEDWELSLRVAENHVIGYLNEVLVDAGHSIDGVNSIRGEEKIKAELYILQRYWDRYTNKSIFENIVRMLYKEIPKLKDSECLLKQLDSIVPREYGMDLIIQFRQKLDKAQVENQSLKNEIQVLTEQLKTQIRHANNLSEELSNMQKHALYQAGEIQRLTEHAANLTEHKQTLLQHAANLTGIIKRMEAQAAEQTKRIQVLEQNEREYLTIVKEDERREIGKLFSCDRNVYLYGAGVVGKQAANQIKAWGFNLKGVLVSDNPKTNDCEGIPMLRADTLLVDDKVSVIIAVSDKYKQELVETVERLGIKNYLIWHA